MTPCSWYHVTQHQQVKTKKTLPRGITQHGTLTMGHETRNYINKGNTN